MGVLGWAMLLDPEHYQNLKLRHQNGAYFRQMSADYTIKAVGSKESIQVQTEAIRRFARSFELIQAVPAYAHSFRSELP